MDKPVHDRDIKIWALDVHRSLHFQVRFTASKNWVNDFKRKYSIVSRRVTNWVAKRGARSELNREEAVKTFLETAQDKMSHYGGNEIFNYNQSGFTFESHSTRSLDSAGSKKVVCAAGSLGDMAHKLTIMPIMFADGALPGCLFIQIGQKGGQFPQRAKLYEADNVRTIASSGHIITISTYKLFIVDCLLPILPDRALLLLDSWGTFGSQEVVKILRVREKYRY